MLTISPYAGGCEICPKGESDSIYVMELAGQPLQMSWRNTQRLVGSFLTMSWAEMEEAYHQGFMDTLCYLDNESKQHKQEIVEGYSHLNYYHSYAFSDRKEDM